MTKVRYAPSPTGRLHLGNARPALLNWLFALKHDATYVLRLDDTDLARSTEESAAGIHVDLAWLGITPDIVVRQQDRIPIYDAARDRLISSGRLYRAYETEDELDRKRARARALNKPPIYDRAALALTEADHARLASEGRKPHWRFRLDGRPVIFSDLIRGQQTVNTASMSDPVLIRGDGSYLYTLTSVVDDVELDITHVIRGEDHVSNTGTQIEIFEALGGEVPIFAHHNLLTGADGGGFSKRLGGGTTRCEEKSPTTRRTTSACTESCLLIVPTGQCSAKCRRRISAATSAWTVIARAQPALASGNSRRRRCTNPRRTQRLARPQNAHRRTPLSPSTTPSLPLSPRDACPAASSADGSIRAATVSDLSISPPP